MQPRPKPYTRCSFSIRCSFLPLPFTFEQSGLCFISFMHPASVYIISRCLLWSVVLGYHRLSAVEVIIYSLWLRVRAYCRVVGTLLRNLRMGVYKNFFAPPPPPPPRLLPKVMSGLNPEGYRMLQYWHGASARLQNVFYNRSTEMV